MSDLPVVLITGAASGMGAQHARVAASLGWHVCLADIADTSPVLATIGSDRRSASSYHLDVTDAEEWARVVSEIRREHGGLRGLVNNAGISKRSRFMDTTHEDWQRILRVNLDGVFYGMQACAPLMRESGRGTIVNISSIAGQVGYFSPAYSASKWAVRGLTKSAADGLAAWGIRVNSVHPGLIETPLVTGADAFVTSSVASIPAGRMGRAEEVSRAVMFLLSEESSYMTGAELTVDGGLTSNGLYHRIVTEAGGDLS